LRFVGGERLIGGGPGEKFAGEIVSGSPKKIMIATATIEDAARMSFKVKGLEKGEQVADCL